MCLALRDVIPGVVLTHGPKHICLYWKVNTLIRQFDMDSWDSARLANKEYYDSSTVFSHCIS